MSLERLVKSLDSRQNKQNCILGADDLNEIKNSEIVELKLLLFNRKPFYLLHLDSIKNDDAELVELVTLMNDCNVSNFSLTGYSIGNKTAMAMADALQRNSLLKKLAFGGFSIDGEHLRKLGDAIQGHKNLLEFSILCQSNISTKDLFYFAMQIAKNTKLASENINGFLLFPPDFKLKAIHFFIFEFLKKIIERNLSIQNLSTETKGINYYNEFAKQWNESIKERLTGLSIDLQDIDTNDLYIKQKKPLSLKNLCFTFIRAHMQHPCIEQKLKTLPHELQEELPKFRQ